MIGIIVADANELFNNELNIEKTVKVDQFTLNYFQINKKRCVIVHSGIGIANAAAATQVLIAKANAQEIYNYGAVGANHNLKIYDLVAPQKIFYHDVITPWYQRGTIPQEKSFYQNSIKLVKTNYLASGSAFIDDKAYLDKISADLNVDIVDMEAAAIAQICYQNHIPFKIIKCVSDTIDSQYQNVNQINQQIKNAAHKAFQKILEIIANN